MYAPERQTARVIPPTPITVAIDDDATGKCLCYGVIADVSEAGACVWTNGTLTKGARLLLRVSFAHPPEVHEITGRVVWENAIGGTALPPPGSGLRRFGVEWQDAAAPCIQRLRELALRSLEESLTPSGRLRALNRDELER